MFAIFISFVTFSYLLTTSLVVLIKNPKSLINISLGVALVPLAFWTLGVAGLTTRFGSNELYGRLVFTVATLGLHGLYLFAYFVNPSLKARVKRTLSPIVSSVVAIAIALLTLTPWILARIEAPLTAGVLPTPVYGPLYPIFLAWTVAIGVSVASLLIKNYRYAHGLQRLQAQTILFGVSLAVMVGILTNLILPATLRSSESAQYTPLSMIILSATLSYAVLRHRFLDIRLVIARSVGYLLALLVLISSYAFITYIVVDGFFAGIKSQISPAVINISLLIFVALTFNPIKRFFDRYTNKFFYRDAYDPQVFFNELNKVLVSTIDLNLLLQKVTHTIATNLNVQYCIIGIKDGTRYGRRVIGTVEKEFLPRDIDAARHVTPHMHQTVIVTDDIPPQHDQLRRLLLKNDIAVLARLANNVRATEEGLGYIVLGGKKAGNPYNSQDVRVIEAVANELVVAIQNALHFEEIENFNETLQQKVDEATKKLRATNEKLRQLDQTKDDFISMASHQLRTPLTSIKGYVSMVLEGDAGRVNPLQRKLLNQSFVSSQRMVYLISDLLNVSRLKTGKFVIEAIPCNLARIIEDETAQLEETAKGRGLKLTYNRPEHFPTFMLDETKMRQVIMNFIDNAIYYTPSGGSIVVELLNKADSIEFTVTDSGMGVPKNEQHRLFSKFFRARNAKRARPDGTGLGLFMAKKVIVAQGGAVIFRSKEGKGSTFGFSFAKERLQAMGGKSIAAPTPTTSVK